MEIAVKMAEMSSEGRGRRSGGGAGGGAGDSPAAGIMGERRPLAPFPVSPSWAAMERAYLGRPDSESGEFYIQNVRRKIPYNFVILVSEHVHARFNQ
jgi:hypothetical protein